MKTLPDRNHSTGPSLSSLASTPRASRAAVKCRARLEREFWSHEPDEGETPSPATNLAVQSVGGYKQSETSPPSTRTALSLSWMNGSRVGVINASRNRRPILIAWPKTIPLSAHSEQPCVLCLWG